MVVEQRLSEEPENAANEEDVDSDVDVDEYSDDISIASSPDEDDNSDCLDVVATNESQPASFGNIVVKNSSEVHFGNKTFYQGPVTIKQFMYNAPNDSVLSLENGKDNPGLETDGIPVSENGGNVIKNGVNGVNHYGNNNKVDNEKGKYTRHFKILI